MSKNTRNRILLTAVAALLLVVVTIAGTVAYLNDVTNTVTNTFSTSNVDITLLEHPLKANSTSEIDKNATPVTSEDGYKMVPGADLQKDPYVTVVRGSEACWIFIKVEEKNNTLSDLTGKVVSYNIDTSVWTQLNGKENVWYKQQDAVARDAATEPTLNILQDQKVTVNAGLNNAQMDQLEGAKNPQLLFTAYAIQQLKFDTAAEAWAEIENTAPVLYDTTAASAATAEGTTAQAPATGN